MRDRLHDVTRDFKTILDLGAHDGKLAHELAAGGGFVVAADLSEHMLRRAGELRRVVADEEFLPFAPNSFDLVISNLSLHHTNDLPGALAQIHKVLKPGGLFLAAVPGGRTLYELRAALIEAEEKISGGVSPRLAPSIDPAEAGALLQRAGFTLPVTDREIVMLTYPDAFALMRDLRGMGESNAHTRRLRHPTRRAIFTEAARLYKQHHNVGDRIPASFEIIFLHGWKHG